MEAMALFAQEGSYWLAGTLTVLAAAIVTAVMLISSRSGRDGG